MGTFPVDDVTPVTDRLELRPWREQLPDALVVGGDQDVLAPDGVHPLLSAVATAFRDHRPLVLTPDAVWLTITLTGTADDWRRIRARVDELPKYIYNPVDAYGGRFVTGWITRRYPYLIKNGAETEPNPMLDLPIDEPRDRTPEDFHGFYDGPGITSQEVPATLNRAVINVVAVGADTSVLAVDEWASPAGQWVVFRPGDTADDAKVVGSSLAHVLQAFLDHGDVDFMVTARLSTLELAE